MIFDRAYLSKLQVPDAYFDSMVTFEMWMIVVPVALKSMAKNCVAHFGGHSRRASGLTILTTHKASTLIPKGPLSSELSQNATIS